MGPIDMGPEGCWLAAFVMAIVGVLASVGAVAWLIWWLFTHLHWS